ncbi:hypothetical protein SAMN05421595_2730 [Austwickia chelonae]|uniref:DUF6798 domain-containing protein n=1 Tax=Austwickia chelonae TaxID=100225 RepID=UPI00058BEEFA|nr:DUF6798 domain-containing protein [Austwickia chelonae]SEW39800.1 hypothetical protein SAMN05421595_2730 [Austwickia chelonae]
MSETAVRAPSPKTQGGGRLVPPAWRRWSGVAHYLSLSAVSGALMVVISQYFPTLERPSLRLGWSDHIVLAPLGIQWADPDAFAGDWFLEKAPQPHWLFDYVVKWGREAGALSEVLTVYWLVTCLVFGLATALLARAWARRGHRWDSWVTTVLVTAIAASVPYSIAGSTWMGYPSAVPNMLGASMLYLLTGLLVTGHYRWTLPLVPMLCAVHVQIGAIGLVLCFLGLLCCIPQIRRGEHGKGLLAAYLASGVAGAMVVVVAMRSRRVAAERADFIEICNTLIPYHCSAASWSGRVVMVAVGSALLAIAAAMFAPTGRRLIFLATVGVSASGTVVAMFLDRYHFPFFGEMMQALNGYRVALVVYPYAAWGVLLPFLRPANTILRGAAAAVCAIAVPMLFIDTGGKIAYSGHKTDVFSWAWLSMGAYALLVAAAALVALLVASPRWRPVAASSVVAGFALWFGVSAVVSGVFYSPRPVAFPWGDKALIAWGQEARKIVPPRTTVLIPPAASHYRLPLERALVADCKDIPYGGEPYKEWKERLNHLGGPSQCTGRGAEFEELSSAQLIKAADRYRADTIIVTPGEKREQVTGLKAAGWVHHPLNSGWVKASIFVRPGARTTS